MFSTAPGFMQTLKEAGCENPATNFYGYLCDSIISRNPESYRSGFMKVAQVSPEDAWKPAVGTAAGAFLGGKGAFRFTPMLLGKGKRTRAIMTLLGLVAGGAVGKKITEPSSKTVDNMIGNRTAGLAGSMLHNKGMADMMAAPFKGMKSAPRNPNPLSFDNGNPLVHYNNFMTNS